MTKKPQDFEEILIPVYTSRINANFNSKKVRQYINIETLSCGVSLAEKLTEFIDYGRAHLKKNSDGINVEILLILVQRIKSYGLKFPEDKLAEQLYIELELFITFIN